METKDKHWIYISLILISVFFAASAANSVEQQPPVERNDSETSISSVAPKSAVSQADSRSATIILASQATQKTTRQEPATGKSHASKSTSTKTEKLDGIKRVDVEGIDPADGRAEGVTEKMTDMGLGTGDLSKVPGESEVTDPTGESLLDDSGNTGPPHPGLTEGRDLLTQPTESDRQDARDSLGESFGLSRDNPKDELFNDQMDSFSGAGDSRLSADEDPKSEDPKNEDLKTEDDGCTGQTCGDQGDGTYNVATDKGTVVNDTPTTYKKTTAKQVIGNIWAGMVEAVGGTDGDDDSSTDNAVIGVRGTPKPDEDASRRPLSAEEAAAVLKNQKNKTGMGGDDFEPGASESSDPSQLREKASKLDVDSAAPYSRPLDDSSTESNESAGFGNAPPESDIKEQTTDPDEPELETDQPGPGTSPGGNIPRD